MTSTKRAKTLSNRVATEAVLAQSRQGAKENQSKAFAPLRLCARNFSMVLCCLVLLAACNGTDVNNSNNTPVISGPPPNTSYPMPPVKGTPLLNMGWQLDDGTRKVFSEFKGSVLVLDFYATWCVPCRDSIPHLIGLQKKYEPSGLRVIGLNVGGPGDEERVPAFAKEFGIQYPLGKPDEDLVTFLLSGVDAIPQTFVFDRQGQLVERFIGFGPETGGHLDSAVETALKTAP